MYKRIDFLKNYLSDIHVGALTRSSKYVIRTALKALGNRELNTIVEYGPGDGVMTAELLRRLSPNGKLLAVEANSNFAESLRKINDARLKIVHGKVQDIASNLERMGFKGLDAVVSSIPSSLLTASEREDMARTAFHALAKGGSLIIFHQYTTLMRGPLKKFFGSVKIHFELRNIMPCFVIIAKKMDLS